MTRTHTDGLQLNAHSRTVVDAIRAKIPQETTFDHLTHRVQSKNVHNHSNGLTDHRVFLEEKTSLVVIDVDFTHA